MTDFNGETQNSRVEQSCLAPNVDGNSGIGASALGTDLSEIVMGTVCSVLNAVCDSVDAGDHERFQAVSIAQTLTIDSSLTAALQMGLRATKTFENNQLDNSVHESKSTSGKTEDRTLFENINEASFSDTSRKDHIHAAGRVSDDLVRKVVIDTVDPGEENDQFVEASDCLLGLPYQDHDYGVRRVTESAEEAHFPVISGLASYIGGNDGEDCNATSQPVRGAVLPVQRSAEEQYTYAGKGISRVEQTSVRGRGKLTRSYLCTGSTGGSHTHVAQQNRLQIQGATQNFLISREGYGRGRVTRVLTSSTGPYSRGHTRPALLAEGTNPAEVPQRHVNISSLQPVSSFPERTSANTMQRTSGEHAQTFTGGRGMAPIVAPSRYSRIIHRGRGRGREAQHDSRVQNARVQPAMIDPHAAIAAPASGHVQPIHQIEIESAVLNRRQQRLISARPEQPENVNQESLAEDEPPQKKLPPPGFFEQKTLKPSISGQPQRQKMECTELMPSVTLPLVTASTATPEQAVGEQPLDLLTDLSSRQDAARRTHAVARSSISGAEEEISLNGGAEEKQMELDDEIEDGKSSSSSASFHHEWQGDYVTRCYCELSHNDEFMIQCDVCSVWQHARCVDIKYGHVPKVYKCEECAPRALKHTKAEVQEVQRKLLEKKRRQKERRRQKKQTKEHNKMVKKVQRSGKNSQKLTEKKNKEKFSRIKFTPSYKYEYTRSVMALARKHDDTGDPAVLDALKKGAGLEVMLVAPDTYGLVATDTYDVGDAVIYLCGRVSLPGECRGREMPGSLVPFVVLISGLKIDDQSEPISICIDARQYGTYARFARPSCTPNIAYEYMFLGGKLYFIGKATRAIERGIEITIPFDADYRLTKEKLTCACWSESEENYFNCAIFALNCELQQAQALLPSVDDVAQERMMGKRSKKRRVCKRKNVEQKTEDAENVVPQGDDAVASAEVSMKELAAPDAPDSVSVDVAPNADDENAPMTESQFRGFKRKSSLSVTRERKRRKTTKKQHSRAVLTSSSSKKKVGIKLRRRQSTVGRRKNMEATALSVGNDRGKASKSVQGRNGVYSQGEYMEPRATRSMTRAAQIEQKQIIEPRQTEQKKTKILEAEGEENSVRSGATKAEQKETIGITEKDNEFSKAKADFERGRLKQSNNESKSEKATSNAESQSQQVEKPTVLKGTVVTKMEEVKAKKTDSSQKPRRNLIRKSKEENLVEVVNYILPEDRKKSVSRDERKIQQEWALFKRLEERGSKRHKDVASGDRKAETTRVLRVRNAKKIDNAKDKEKAGKSGRLKRSRDEKKMKSKHLTRRSPLFTAVERKRTLSDGKQKHERSSSSRGTDERRTRTAEVIERQAKQDMKEDNITELEKVVAEEMQGTSEISSNAEVCRENLSTGAAEKLCDPSFSELINEEPLSSGSKTDEDKKMEETATKEAMRETEKIRKMFQQLCNSTAANTSMEFSLDELIPKTEKKQAPDITPQEVVVEASTSACESRSSSVSKKKMSLAEYIERKKHAGERLEKKSSSPNEQVLTPRPSLEEAFNTNSFIPPISTGSETTARRSSVRLGGIPEPARLQQPATMPTIDDLKRRIYGCVTAPATTSTTASAPTSSTSSAPSASSPAEKPSTSTDSNRITRWLRSSTSQQQSQALGRQNRQRRTPPPPPPPLPPPPPPPAPLAEPASSARLPLEERLRQVFGGAGDDASSYQHGTSFEVQGTSSGPVSSPEKSSSVRGED